jgi:hypothetical protein
MRDCVSMLFATCFATIGSHQAITPVGVTLNYVLNDQARFGHGLRSRTRPRNIKRDGEHEKALNRARLEGAYSLECELRDAPEIATAS